MAQYKLDENNSPTEFMEFLYDDTGSITGFSYEGKTYFYVKNPQGDVTNIVDSNGINLINYYYYSYGESAFDIDESAYDYGYTRDDMDTVLSNPITYRGYYRDEETAFYYLQSRYYIPSGGRFLNADIPLYAQLQKDITAGLNLFAYCNNDPVNYVDENGFSAVVAGSAFTYYFVNYVLPNIFIYGIATTTGILFAYLLIKAVSDSISNSGSSGSSKSPKKPKNNPKIQKILKRIPNSLKNGDKVDLSKFNSPVKGKTAWKSSNGWTIEKDTAKHGGRVWKLFDKAGKRIASLGADGSVLAK